MISTTLRSVRMYSTAAAMLLCAASASAQFQPRPLNDPASGEKYHIEFGAAYWFPTAEIKISSESLGIAGTTIDFKTDLGLGDKALPQLSLVLRPQRRHKFRAQLIPIKYEQTGTLTRDLIFNGQRYRLGVPVASTLDWKAYRFNYEFDFVARDWGFVGFITEVKYTDVQAQLNATSGGITVSEFAHARAPIPALGGVVRVYFVPQVSDTLELTGFKIPDSIDSRYNAHYVDIDVYGTVNFTNNVGVQAGYRSLDFGYLIKSDAGTFTFKGLYFGGVVRY